MDNYESLLPFGVYILGVLSRIVLPYAYEKVQSKGALTFNGRYLIGQALGAIIGLVPTWIAPDFALSIVSAAPGVVFGYGWGASDIGNRVISKPLVDRSDN